MPPPRLQAAPSCASGCPTALRWLPVRWRFMFPTLRVSRSARSDARWLHRVVHRVFPYLWVWCQKYKAAS